MRRRDFVGNITGVSDLLNALEAKRFGLLRELVHPKRIRGL
jgi:hypothetical protein